MKKDNLLKKVYYIILFFYLIFCTHSFFINLSKHYYHSLSMSLIGYFMIFLFPIIFKVLKLKKNYFIYSCGLCFICMATVFGSGYRLYDLTLYWDKVVHFTSGILGVIIAYIIMHFLFKQDKFTSDKISKLLVFINAINISFATLWELYEYFLLVFFNYDAIRNKATGIHDSMTDILVCILGGLISSAYIYWKIKYNKKSNILTMCDDFYTDNKKKN